MSEKVVAVDIDEVLSLLHKHFLEHHNERYGTTFVYPDPENRYYLEEFTGETSESAEVKIKTFVDDPIFKEVITPLPNAAKVLKKLKQAGYKFHIVTGRQPFYDMVTKHFLETHMPGIFDSVHFIPHSPGAALSPAAAKLKICADLGAHYLIDDNLGTITAAAKAGMQGILFGDYHWNKHESLPVGAVYCKDWLAVEDYFDGQR